ncbi:calcium channel protein [Allomyces arbusculus]|nr:calcium channel protein [Allomyces arbusculus]
MGRTFPLLLVKLELGDVPLSNTQVAMQRVFGGMSPVLRHLRLGSEFDSMYKDDRAGLAAFDRGVAWLFPLLLTTITTLVVKRSTLFAIQVVFCTLALVLPQMSVSNLDLPLGIASELVPSWAELAVSDGAYGALEHLPAIGRLPVAIDALTVQLPIMTAGMCARLPLAPTLRHLTLELEFKFVDRFGLHGDTLLYLALAAPTLYEPCLRAAIQTGSVFLTRWLRAAGPDLVSRNVDMGNFATERTPSSDPAQWFLVLPPRNCDRMHLPMRTAFGEKEATMSRTWSLLPWPLGGTATFRTLMAHLPPHLLSLTIKKCNITADDLSGCAWPQSLQYLRLRHNRIIAALSSLPQRLLLLDLGYNSHLARYMPYDWLVRVLPASLRWLDVSMGSPADAAMALIQWPHSPRASGQKTQLKLVQETAPQGAFAKFLERLQGSQLRELILCGMAALRVFRLRSLMPGTSMIVKTLAVSRSMLLNVFYFVGYFFLIGAITGVLTFKGTFHRHCMVPHLDGSLVGITPTQYCGGYEDPVLDGAQLTPLGSNAVDTKGYICPRPQVCVANQPNPHAGFASFDSIWSNLLVMFMIVSLENWSEFLYGTQDGEMSEGAALFFVLLIIVLRFLLIQLFAAVITEAFVLVHAEFKEARRKAQLAAQRREHLAKQAAAANNKQPVVAPQAQEPIKRQGFGEHIGFTFNSVVADSGGNGRGGSRHGSTFVPGRRGSTLPRRQPSMSSMTPSSALTPPSAAGIPHRLPPTPPSR